MMSKEEVIGTLDNAKHFTYGDEKFNDAFDSAINYLKETMWIPVKERLPEEEKWYPCTIEGHDINGNRMRIEDTCAFVNGKFFGDKGIEYNVIAWREPKPYEGSETE